MFPSSRQQGLELTYCCECVQTFVCGPPPSYPVRRPRVHGQFKLSDATTWAEPAATLELQDSNWGECKFNTGSTYISSISCTFHAEAWIVADGRVEATVLPSPCGCVGLVEKCPLEQTWRYYLRRFAVDHWNRFAKQRLHWTLPHVGTLNKPSGGVTSCR